VPTCQLSAALSVAAMLLVAASSGSLAKDTRLVFVSNERTNNLIIIDPKTNTVVKDLKTSRRPRDMHFNADHTELYVACGDDDVIDIIDVAKLEVVGKLSTGASPETFGIDESRRRMCRTRKVLHSPSSILFKTSSCKRCRPARSLRAYSSAKMATSSM
jgi:YVTN family beta-propeller protein